MNIVAITNKAHSVYVLHAVGYNIIISLPSRNYYYQPGHIIGLWSSVP